MQKQDACNVKSYNKNKIPKFRAIDCVCLITYEDTTSIFEANNSMSSRLVLDLVLEENKN